MNVYFCDVCGVRVTDLDLHSGHGMRRRNDVICAACLELGHGKGWVANHAQKQQLAFAGAATGASSVSSASAIADGEPSVGNARHPTPVPAMEMARDRLRTLNDDQPPEPVAPVRFEAPLPDSDLQPAPPSLDEPVTADDTAKVQVLHQELSTAAAGFAALNPPPVKKAIEEPEDDLQDAPHARLDDSGGSALLSDHAATPEQELDAEKAETASNAAVSDGTSVTVESKRKATTSRSTARNRTSSSTGTSSKVSKVSKVSKSSKVRPGKRAKTGIPPIILFSAAGLALIVLVGVLVISNENVKDKTGGGTVTVKLNAELISAKKDALSALSEAMAGNDVAKLEDAKSKIMVVKRKAIEFQDAAMKTGKWTEDDLNRQMEGYELSDLYEQLKLIDDKEAILKQDASH